MHDAITDLFVIFILYRQQRRPKQVGRLYY